MMRIQQGADWGRFWPLANPDGTPILDWSGWAALAQVRDTPATDSPVLWSWQTDPDDDAFAGIAVFGGSPGGITLAHNGADSLPWTWRLGVWDLRVTNPSGQVAFTARGRVMVLPAVTRT